MNFDRILSFHENSKNVVTCVVTQLDKTWFELLYLQNQND